MRSSTIAHAPPPDDHTLDLPMPDEAAFNPRFFEEDADLEAAGLGGEDDDFLDLALED